MLVLVTLTVQAETLTGKVVGVHDGDVLTLLGAGNQPVKVRLAGMDAPELKQPYGQQAKQALSALAFRKEARAESPEPDKVWPDFRNGVGGRGECECGIGETGRGVGVSGLSVSAGTGGAGGASASGTTWAVGVAGRPAVSTVGFSA